MNEKIVDRILALADKQPRRKLLPVDVEIRPQDEKHLLALMLEAYASAFASRDSYISEGFSALARAERQEH